MTAAPPARTDFDLMVIGAGPAGLALARALSGDGLAIALIERQPRSVLESPPFDGREIALTQQSVDHLRTLGAWDRLPPGDISPLHEARVLNGPFEHALRFQPIREAGQNLGYFVPNHLIRRSLFESLADCPDVTLLDRRTATGIAADDHTATLTFADGTKLTSRLIVAADTRFSEMRRRMGITATRRDFHKTMLVCRMAHEKPHHAVATEWFGYGRTIAILPLNGTQEAPNLSSMILTQTAPRIAALTKLDDGAYGKAATRLYQGRLGAMRPVGPRLTYPLVGVYADRFVGRRFALIGDAAVGMHPVTAHGFNLGLAGAASLAELVSRAAAAGKDIGAASLLATFEGRHRRATGPLYLATNMTVSLFTNDRFPARVMRDAVIRAGEYLAPVRHAISAHLMNPASTVLSRNDH
jgi:ubiquinone biosynthesis UbiH/UbiF/VisC/COQ6 family hydroxylase